MNKRTQRRAKIRKTIRGTASCPRLVVFKSNKFFYAQLIDDDKRQTLVSVNKMTDPIEAGKKLAEQTKVKEIVFDRAGYRYHGNVKKFADAVRESGIKF